MCQLTPITKTVSVKFISAFNPTIVSSILYVFYVYLEVTVHVCVKFITDYYYYIWHG